jgi:hypothetical protein
MTEIKLTPAEIQSDYDRVAWAEGLILQLPSFNEARNSWLISYGHSEEAALHRANWEDSNGKKLIFDSATKAYLTQNKV